MLATRNLNHARTARIVTGLKTSAMLAPFAFNGAFAQTADPSIGDMASSSKAGADAVKTGVVGIVGVVVLIATVWWAVTKLKPKS